MALRRFLDNVCTTNCGEKYRNYLKSVCKDELAAESLSVHCTPTDGSAAVGSFCRCAAGDVIDRSILDGLFLCYNSTANQTCRPSCRRALLHFEEQVGCCYQQIYNNTFYNTLLREFTGLEELKRTS